MRKGDYLPLLSASVSHRRSEQSGINVGYRLNPRNRYTEYGLNASWMLFDRFTRNLRLQEAKISENQAQLSTYELRRDIKLQVRSTIDILKSLHQQALVAEQNSRWAERTLEFEQERYRLGSATVIELGAAQLSFIQAQSDQIRIETDYHKAIGDLEMAVGKVLR